MVMSAALLLAALLQFRVFLPAIVKDAPTVTTSTTTTVTSSTTSTTLPFPVLSLITPPVFSLSAPGPLVLTIHGVGLSAGMSLYMDVMGLHPLTVLNSGVATVSIDRNTIPLQPGEELTLPCYLMRGELTSDFYFWAVKVLN